MMKYTFFFSPPYSFPKNLNLRHILPFTLNQLVKSPIFYPAQRERAFFCRHEYAMHFIAMAFPISNPTQHHFMSFLVPGSIFSTASSFFIQHSEKFAFEVYPVWLVLQPRCNVRGGSADEGGFEGRGERSFGTFLTAAFGLFLGGCLED